MHKELTTVTDTCREHGLNICAVLMSRLIYGTRLWFKTPLVLTLWWRYLDRELVPVVSQVAPAPVSALQLVRCNCDKSKCSQRCSCRENNVVCTELCKCGREGDKCTNIRQPMIGEDIDD